MTVNSPMMIGSFSLGFDTTVGSFPGVVNGTADITVTGPFIFQGSTLGGSGTVFANGGVTFSDGSSSSHVTINGRTLNMSGASTWAGGTIFLANGVLINSAGGVLTATSNVALTYSSTLGGTVTFSNNGTFVQQAGSGSIGYAAFPSAVTFTNTGTVDVQSGTLTLLCAGTNSGTLNVATGATLQFAGGTFTLNAGSSLTGGGSFLISDMTASDTVIVSGTTSATRLSLFDGVLTVNAPLTVGTLFVGNTLNGTADVTVNGLLTFPTGTLGGSGNIAANGGVLFTGTGGTPSLSGRSLTMTGASTWSGGNINVGSSSVLTNTAGSTLTAMSDNTLTSNLGGNGAFVNNGTFIKQTGTGTTTIGGTGFTFTNTGTVNVQSGTLSIAGTGTNTGVINVAAGADFRINSGGSFAFNAGTVVSGAGLLDVGGGTLTVATPISLTILSVFGAGAVTANSPLTVGTLFLSPGTLNGTADVTVNGQFTFDGSTLSGSGNVAANGGSTFTASSTSTVNGRSLILGGASTWSSGNINLGNGGVLTNAAGGTLTATSDNVLTNNLGGTGAFVNNGTFVKQTGIGNTTFINGVTFTNTGSVNVQTGTLAVASGIANSGTVQVAFGATISGSITSAGSGALVRGTGIYSGALILNNGSTLHPGGSPGILTVANNPVTMNAGSFFAVDLNGTTAGTGYSQLVLSGTGATIALNNPTLQTTLGYNPGLGDVFSIISGLYTGQFNNLPEGAIIPLNEFAGGQMHYGSNVVQLDVVAVPEAGNLLLVLAVISGLVSTVWRK